MGGGGGGAKSISARARQNYGPCSQARHQVSARIYHLLPLMVYVCKSKNTLFSCNSTLDYRKPDKVSGCIMCV